MMTVKFRPLLSLFSPTKLFSAHNNFKLVNISDNQLRYLVTLVANNNNNNNNYNKSKQFLRNTSPSYPGNNSHNISSRTISTNNNNMSDKMLKQTLKESDPELYNLIKLEKERQTCGLEMIASENFTSQSVLEVLGSCLTNKYSEGYPNQRYYGGNLHIDKIEIMCQQRALEVYGCDPEKWGVNVQALSGSPANFAVFTGVVGPHGRIMGLDLPDGGHLTHGFYTATKKVSATSMFFESMPYKSDPETGLIDYDELERNAKLFKPKLIIAGISCYPRYLDYKRFRDICDSVGAYLMADMAHISGLVAGRVCPSPFEYADIVTSTTHKSLRGPRSGLIFYRKGVRSVHPKTGAQTMFDLENMINAAIFPGLQGGPHNSAIAGVATAMKQALTPEFRQYQQQIVANAKRLASSLTSLGYKIVTGGTDVHIVWVDLRNKNISGSLAARLLEEISIACNKNTVPGDLSALNPSGIRLGTPALTTRGLNEGHMDQVAAFIDEGVKLSVVIRQKMSSTSLTPSQEMAAFNKLIVEAENKKMIDELKERIETFAKSFFMPGDF